MLFSKKDRNSAGLRILVGQIRYSLSVLLDDRIKASPRCGSQPYYSVTVACLIGGPPLRGGVVAATSDAWYTSSQPGEQGEGEKFKSGGEVLVPGPSEVRLWI